MTGSFCLPPLGPASMPQVRLPREPRGMGQGHWPRALAELPGNNKHQLASHVSEPSWQWSSLSLHNLEQRQGTLLSPTCKPRVNNTVVV